MVKKFGKWDIVTHVADKKINISRRGVREVLDGVLGYIGATLKDGNTIDIRSFGAFKVVDGKVVFVPSSSLGR